MNRAEQLLTWENFKIIGNNLEMVVYVFQHFSNNGVCTLAD